MDIAVELKELDAGCRGEIRSTLTALNFQQCVEELLLNSIDSGSTCIAVRINLVTGFLQVVDNGKGVEEKCMDKIGLRYNSSKDLPSNTAARYSAFGYRGEALASIIDMCEKLEITSRYSKSNVTLRKEFIGGKGFSVNITEEERPSTGTTIAVHNIFYKAPVRRKAIDPRESLYEVMELVQRIACLHHTISLSVRNEDTGRVGLSTKPCSSHRASILSVFGPQYAIKLRPISGSCERIQINGVISKVAYSRRRIKLIAVNKRIVHSKRLHRAVDKELKNSLICIHGESSRKEKDDKVNMVTRTLNYLYVLNLSMDERRYDVTFEPSKKMIAFSNEDKVIDVITKLVRKFVYSHNLHKGVSEETFNSINSSCHEVFHDTHEPPDPMEKVDNSVQLWGSDDAIRDEVVSSKQKDTQIPSAAVCEEYNSPQLSTVLNRNSVDNISLAKITPELQKPQGKDVKAWLCRGLSNVRHWLLHQVPTVIEPLEPTQKQSAAKMTISRKLKDKGDCDPLTQQSMLVNVPDDISLSDLSVHKFTAESPIELDEIINTAPQQHKSVPFGINMNDDVIFESGMNMRTDAICDQLSLVNQPSSFDVGLSENRSDGRGFSTRLPFSESRSSSADIFLTPGSRCNWRSKVSTYKSSRTSHSRTPIQSPFQRVREICKQYAYSVPVKSTQYGLSAYLNDDQFSGRSAGILCRSSQVDLHGLITPVRRRHKTSFNF